ncbi:ATP-dependent nuclease [Thermococcus barossii]|uniref:Uncharacterized protein n=1 Tax=Thermococcus barossii TaxID=54077 RepID=A0A2Z2MTQ0_9EURY|nr:ATP-dependent endonuclease [Thermococcus barossii]ASJ05368.1 hypothetical protein A3L01_08335 [Thermococcus barossii]
MRIVGIEIENFRSLKHVTIPIDDLTILIGRNGAGKSSVLKALELFFNPNAKYSEEDFYARNTDSPIKITVTFELTNEQEINEFRGYVIEENGKRYMKVVKIMKFPPSKSNQTYHGITMGIPQFSELPSKKEDLIKKYNKLRSEFPGLPDLGENPTKKKILETLKEYEANHPEKKKPVLKDIQFFGYREVGKGKIGKFMKLIFVPAVKDVSEEAEYKRGSIITEITQMIIESHIRSNPQFNRLEKRYKKILEGMNKKGRKKENMGLFYELGHEVTQILEKFAPNTRAYIKWNNLEEFQLPLPTPEVLVNEDGFEVHVDKVGHGTQRALLFSLLQYIVKKKYEITKTEKKEITIKSNPTLFLIIEELELYQHPQRQKHLHKLFKSLAGSTFEGFNIQVMYSTHSPFLVSIDTFNNLRLLRKEGKRKSKKPKETKVYLYSQHQFMKDLEEFGIESPSRQLKKFTTTINPVINEGFFADKVVLVEGWSDKAALEVVSEYNDIDLEGNNISIIPVGGKGNILSSYLLFTGFNIPTYIIWDFDRDNDEQNKHLFNAVGYKSKRNIASSIIKKNFAVLNKNLEDVIKRDLGSKNWHIVFSKLRKDNIILGKDDLKNYAPMKRFIELWYNPTDDIKDKLIKSSGESLKTLEKIVKEIARL